MRTRISHTTQGKRKIKRALECSHLATSTGHVPLVASRASVRLLSENGNNVDGDVVKVECAEEVLSEKVNNNEPNKNEQLCALTLVSGSTVKPATLVSNADTSGT